MEKLTFVSTVFAVLLLNFFFIILAYFANVSGHLAQEPLQDKPIYVAFKNPRFIYIGLIMNVTCSLTNIVDLILDVMHILLKYELELKKEHDSWFERMFLVLLNIFSCISVLFLRENENIPYIYSCVHAFQYVGCMAVILLLCHKLEPKFFPRENIIITVVSFGAASVSSMLGFGHGISFWANILTFFLIGSFFYFFLGRMMVPWLLNIRVAILSGKDLSTTTLCCLWYSFSTTIVIIIVPGIVALTSLFDWCEFTAPDVYIFVYSFVLYGMIISSVPGRLAKVDAASEKRMVEIKQAFFRYLGHEVRSPFNVIYSGISFMENDVKALPPSREKDLIVESLQCVRQACQDVLQALSDMLQMENMNSGNFFLERKMVPCKEIIEMVENCGIVAKQKGVAFSVNESIAIGAIEGNNNEGNDIEEGFSIEVTATKLESLAFFVDKFKLGQVLRNLITNAAKFTSTGQSISVNFRPPTAEDLALLEQEDVDRLAQSPWEYSISGPSFSTDYRFYRTVLIEVVDTGCGVALEDQPKLFGAFTQFNANELQVVLAYF